MSAGPIRRGPSAQPTNLTRFVSLRTRSSATARPYAWVIRRVGRPNTPKGARHCPTRPAFAVVGGRHARLSDRCSSSARAALGCLSGLVDHTLISGDTCSHHGQFGWWYAQKEGTPPRRRSKPLPKLQLSLRLERRQLSACSRRVPAYVVVAAVWALTALIISHCTPSCVLLVENAVFASSCSCGYGGGLEELEAQSWQVPQVSIRALVVCTDCAGHQGQ